MQWARALFTPRWREDPSQGPHCSIHRGTTPPHGMYPSPFSQGRASVSSYGIPQEYVTTLARVENIVSRDETLVLRNEALVSRDETRSRQLLNTKSQRVE